MASNLRLRIHSVKCVDETGGRWDEKFGNDEIYLGGFVIDPGNSAYKIAPFSVYPHFDDGDIKIYNPPLEFTDFNLVASQSWPKTVTAGFLLFEKDLGGMKNFNDQVFSKLQQEIQINPGNAITKVTIFVAAYLGDSDDVFPLKTASVSIPHSNHTWNGSTESDGYTIEFRGHQGIYKLVYSWQLYDLLLI